MPHVTGYGEWTDPEAVAWNNVVGALTLAAEPGRWYRVNELRDMAHQEADGRNLVLEWNQKTPATKFLTRGWEKHPSRSTYRVVQP